MAISYDQQIGQFNFGIPMTNGPYAQDVGTAGPYADTTFTDYTRKLAIIEGTPDSTEQASGFPVGQKGSSSATFEVSLPLQPRAIELAVVGVVAYVLLFKK